MPALKTQVFIHLTEAMLGTFFPAKTLLRILRTGALQTLRLTSFEACQFGALRLLRTSTKTVSFRVHSDWARADLENV